MRHPLGLWSRLIPFILLIFLFIGLALALRCLFWDTMAKAIRSDMSDTVVKRRDGNNSPVTMRPSPAFDLPDFNSNARL
jgi:hypothetical protein